MDDKTYLDDPATSSEQANEPAPEPIVLMVNTRALDADLLGMMESAEVSLGVLYANLLRSEVSISRVVL